MKTTIAVILTAAAANAADLKVWHWVRDGETNKMVFTSSGAYEYRTGTTTNVYSPTQRRDFERAIRKVGWVNMTERNEFDAVRAHMAAEVKAAKDRVEAERNARLKRERERREYIENLNTPILRKIGRLEARLADDIEERQELLINGADADEIVNINLRISNTMSEITRLKKQLRSL